MGSEYERTGSACCFCFSIKKSDVRRSNSGILSSKQRNNWGKNEEVLSDMSTFSVEEQERRLKMAMKEEERVSREAERIVQWVKQESARMDASEFKTIVSDHESERAAPKQGF